MVIRVLLVRYEFRSNYNYLNQNQLDLPKIFLRVGVRFPSDSLILPAYWHRSNLFLSWFFDDDDEQGGGIL